jgi:hypothetical protein
MVQGFDSMVDTGRSIGEPLHAIEASKAIFIRLRSQFIEMRFGEAKRHQSPEEVSIRLKKSLVIKLWAFMCSRVLPS